MVKKTIGDKIYKTLFVVYILGSFLFVFWAANDIQRQQRTIATYVAWILALSLPFFAFLYWHSLAQRSLHRARLRSERDGVEWDGKGIVFGISITIASTGDGDGDGGGGDDGGGDGGGGGGGD